MKNLHKSYNKLKKAIEMNDIKTLIELSSNGYLDSKYVILLNNTYDKTDIYNSMKNEALTKFEKDLHTNDVIKEPYDMEQINQLNLLVNVSSDVFNGKLNNNETVIVAKLEEQFDMLKNEGMLNNTIFDLEDFNILTLRAKRFLSTKFGGKTIAHYEVEMKEMTNIVRNISTLTDELKKEDLDFTLNRDSVTTSNIGQEDDRELSEFLTTTLRELELRFEVEHLTTHLDKVKVFYETVLTPTIEQVRSNFIETVDEKHANQQYIYLKALLSIKDIMLNQYSFTYSYLTSYPRNIKAIVALLNIK